MYRIAVLLLLMPLPALAGGWLRPAGSGFLSFQQSFSESLDRALAPSVYLDYGLRDDLTIGVIAWQSETRNKTRVEAFARSNLPLAFDGWAMSGELRLGGEQSEDRHIAPLASLSVGAGRPLAQGWFDSAWSVTVPLRDPMGWDAKGELSLGHNLNDDWATMGQIRFETSASDRSTAMSGWMIYQARPDLRIAAGAEHMLDESGHMRALLSIWTDF